MVLFLNFFKNKVAFFHNVTLKITWLAKEAIASLVEF
jgi:hypothetical protein